MVNGLEDKEVFLDSGRIPIEEIELEWIYSIEMTNLIVKL